MLFLKKNPNPSVAHDASWPGSGLSRALSLALPENHHPKGGRVAKLPLAVFLRQSWDWKRCSNVRPRTAGVICPQGLLLWRGWPCYLTPACLCTAAAGSGVLRSASVPFTPPTSTLAAASPFYTPSPSVPLLGVQSLCGVVSHSCISPDLRTVTFFFFALQ